MQRLVLTLAGAGMLAACGAASPGRHGAADHERAEFDRHDGQHWRPRHSGPC